MLCLKRNENYYQEAFTFIKNKLHKLIFLPLPHQIDDYMMNLRKVAEISKNTSIISSIYPSTQEKVTFKKLLTFFMQQIFTLSESAKKQHSFSNSQIQHLKQIVEEKEQLINKLTQKLNFYQSHPSQNKYPQLQQLKEENKLLRNQFEQQTFKINVLNHNLQLLHETKIMNENKIESLKKQIARYEMDKLTNVKQVQKSSQLKLFQDNVTMLKEMLDRSIIRMSGMKQEYDKLKSYNQNLINERDNLSKRAAVGFGQLTPRPNLKKIFQANNMNLSQVFDTQLSSSKKNDKKMISTEKFVQTLICKFKNYYQSYKLQQSQVSPSKKGKKMLKEKQRPKQKQRNKDLFDSVMDEVYEVKSHINKTMQSVEDVRNAYNKKQSEESKK